MGNQMLIVNIPRVKIRGWLRYIKYHLQMRDPQSVSKKDTISMVPRLRILIHPKNQCQEVQCIINNRPNNKSSSSLDNKITKAERTYNNNKIKMMEHKE